MATHYNTRKISSKGISINEDRKQKSIHRSRKKSWDREEVVILVTEYFRTKNFSNEEIIESQKKTSEFLRYRERVLSGEQVDEEFRNFAGIHMQSGRIRCLDPDTHYNGMQGTKLQKQIVQEYLANPYKMNEEATRIYKKYKDSNI